MANKAKKVQKTGILDKINVEDANTFKTSCQIKQLTLKEDRWKLDLMVFTILSRAFYRYNVKLVFNEDPYLRNIKDMEDEIGKLNTEAALFKNKERIKELEMEIQETKAEMEDYEAKCPKIEFFGTVDSLKYPSGGSRLVLLIGDNIINLLNETKRWFGYYRLELRPQKD